MEDSPAIDAGNTTLAVDQQGSPLLLDQRGVDRVFGSGVDIGAVEWIPSIGLYFDTDNYTDGYLSFGARVMPERSEREEFYKTSPYGLGKVMIPNWGDSDNDGILDCWDGYHIGGYDQTALGNGARSEVFYPIVLEIPESLDISQMKFEIDYNFGSTTATNGTNNPPRYGDGNIRIWTKNGPEARDANGPNLDGDLIMPRTDTMYYTAEELGFTNEVRTIVLYVEAVKENVVQYHTEGGWFEESDWNNVYGNVKPTTTIFVSMEYMGYVVSDEVPYIVSHNDPNKSETSSFWFNVLAHEEFRQAVASSAIYNRDDLPQFGMQLLEMAELAEMGITTEARLLLSKKYPGDWWSTITGQEALGFNAGIYYDHVTGKAVLTFQGTDEVGDWTANLGQGFGLSTVQYDNAMIIGQSLLSLYGDGSAFVPLSQTTPTQPTDFMITGHSLGGGLASSATIVTGFATNTFNAAGLSPITILSAQVTRVITGYGILSNPESLVTAHITENDFLDNFQWVIGILGINIRAFGQIVSLQDENWIPSVEAHKMPQVFYGLMYRYKYEI